MVEEFSSPGASDQVVLVASGELGPFEVDSVGLFDFVPIATGEEDLADEFGVVAGAEPELGNYLSTL